MKFWKKIRQLPVVQIATANNRLFFLMLIAGLLPLFLSSFVVLYLEANQVVFERGLTELLVWTTLLAVVLIGFALTPSTIVAILCGHYLQLWGLIPILVSYPLAALIGLNIGKWLIRLTDAKFFYKIPEYGKYLNSLEKHNFSLVAYFRLSPLLPFAMMNVFMAALPLTLRDFILGSMVGMLPRTLIFFWAGMNAKEIWLFLNEPSLTGLWQLFPLVLVFISLLGLVSVAKSVFRS